MIAWDETKRAKNKAKHGIDLADVESAFDVPMLTIEDDRTAYGEQRLRSSCFLNGAVVVLVWTERESGPHVISCRYGDKHEADEYFETFF